MAPLSETTSPVRLSNEPFTPDSLPLPRYDTTSSSAGGSTVMSPNPVVAPGKNNDRSKKVTDVFSTLYEDDESMTTGLESPFQSLGNQYPVLGAPTENMDVGIRGSIEDVDNDSSEHCPAGDVMKISEQTVGTESKSQVQLAREVSMIDKAFVLQKEWIGNSQFFEEANIELQEQGHLEMLLDFYKALLHDQSIAPYDPVIYVELGGLFNKLAFCDIAVGNAHRALILTKAALAIKTVEPIPEELGEQVKQAVAKKSYSFNPNQLQDELESIHLRAYIELLNGLLGCAAFWEGITAAKAALKLWPNNPAIMELQDYLKAGFLDRNRGLIELGSKGVDLIATTRCGQIYQKKYPWMDEELFFRTPALLREINKNFGTGKCEVRRVVFGPQAALGSENVMEGQDVGPCGVFAKRNIRRGEIVLVDHSITGISDVPSSNLRHCDACHAALFPPYTHPSEIFKPSCCDRVAYCSRSCIVTATETSGYHKILCGKDIDWVYENTGTKGTKSSSSAWQGPMALRVIAIILADIKKNPNQHPLQHPLLARMSANYVNHPADYNQPENTHDWLYTENVVVPTRILLQLGVDIFTDLNWTQEVIQTMCWRLQNNANATISKLLPDAPPVSMVNINTQYLFLNHSCLPNLSWHGSIPTSDVGIEWVQNEKGEVQRPGSSAVFCLANRDIKAGEELKISYVGDPMGSEHPDGEGGMVKFGGEGQVDVKTVGRMGKRAWLEKWFDNGCGCEVCERENAEEKSEGKKSRAKISSTVE